MKYTIFLPDGSEKELDAEGIPKVGDVVRILEGSHVRTFIVQDAAWEIKEVYDGKVKGVDTFRNTICFVLVLKDPA